MGGCMQMAFSFNINRKRCIKVQIQENMIDLLCSILYETTWIHMV